MAVNRASGKDVKLVWGIISKDLVPDDWRLHTNIKYIALRHQLIILDTHVMVNLLIPLIPT